ncbi:50S ribosomal protein L1 [Candidatus Gracilibacteria bacterium]|nr:50S ribosomal protein L1 [Candidatus Gracilibacteria bacterium]
MPKHGKKYDESKKKFDSDKIYSYAEAIELLKTINLTKFDPTVEIAVKTNANPKYNDQMIRSTTILPNGTGKSKRVAVYVGDDKLEEVKKSGADVVGSEALLTDIKNGKFDFDVLLTTPESIKGLVSVAKQLGPKGLMPTPKAGTVTTNIVQSVEEIKKGKIEFRLDKTGNIHAGIGKLSFGNKKLEENLESFLKAVEDNKPVGVKGKLVKKVVVSTSMSPGIQVEC